MTCPDWQLCVICCRRILKGSYADALRRDRWMSVLTGKLCQDRHSVPLTPETLMFLTLSAEV